MMTGDLNINLLEKSSSSILVNSLAQQFNLKQLIVTPTRIRGDSATLLDHLYVDQFFQNSFSGTFDLTTSDHKAIFVIKHNVKVKVPYTVLNAIIQKLILKRHRRI